jgi:hypothetical protein
LPGRSCWWSPWPANSKGYNFELNIANLKTVALLAGLVTSSVTGFNYFAATTTCTGKKFYSSGNIDVTFTIIWLFDIQWFRMFSTRLGVDEDGYQKIHKSSYFEHFWGMRTWKIEISQRLR